MSLIVGRSIGFPDLKMAFMDPDILVDNIIIWFGHEIDQRTYDDYLMTYIDILKPEYVYSFIYRLFYSGSKTREFQSKLAAKGIKLVSNDAQNR